MAKQLSLSQAARDCDAVLMTRGCLSGFGTSIQLGIEKVTGKGVSEGGGKERGRVRGKRGRGGG